MSAPASWYAERLRAVENYLEVWAAQERKDELAPHIFQWVLGEVNEEPPAPESPGPCAGQPD